MLLAQIIVGDGWQQVTWPACELLLLTSGQNLGWMAWVYSVFGRFVCFRIWLLTAILMQITLSYHLEIVLVVVLLNLSNILRINSINIQHVLIILINLLWLFPVDIVTLFISAFFHQWFLNVYLMRIFVVLLFLSLQFWRLVRTRFLILYIWRLLHRFDFSLRHW